MKYYNSSKIDKKNATYNVIFGERSNGKTYRLLMKALKQYAKTGKQFGYVRRWKEDITGRRASSLFSGVVSNDEVNKQTNGEFNHIHYFAGKFYLANLEEGGKPVYSDRDIIGHVFALSDGEHNKSTSYPDIDLIIFDEFLSNKLYLNDEFVLFMNTVSTIVRRRTTVKIYMLGNTVNKYSPYFSEMGLNNILKMKQGSIDVYSYGNSNLKVAVEYCESNNSGNKETNKYFAFDNPKLSMITGGAWELSIYPHLPVKYAGKDVIQTIYILFSDKIYQGNIIYKDGGLFLYIHNKTTDIKDDSNLVYSLDTSHKPNYNVNIFKPTNKLSSIVCDLFRTSKVFYQDNSVGDAISNFIKICKGL